MSATYQLVFMPYLSLGRRDRVQVGDVEIWNFDTQSASIGDPLLRGKAADLLAMYRYSARELKTSAPIRDMGVVTIGARDFRPLSPTEFDRVQEARYLLFLCCLANNALLHGPNAGHMMVTAENFDLFRQNFDLAGRYLSESTGVLISMQIGGYVIGETIFTKPGFVNLPHAFRIDELLLAELLAMPGKNAPLYRRIVRASALFLESYYNSPAVDIGARVLLQAAAFEVLFDLPEDGPRKVFKEQIESLLNNPGEPTFEYKIEVRNGFKRERRTLKGMWADRFYTLRNHIIHGEDVRPREFTFLRAQNHLLASTVIFTQAIKRLVDGERSIRGERRRFFERIHWGVIDEGDEYEARRIGFRADTDFEALLGQWIDDQAAAGPDQGGAA